MKLLYTKQIIILLSISVVDTHDPTATPTLHDPNYNNSPEQYQHRWTVLY